MKKTSILTMLLMGSFVFSQVGINTPTPKSTLDIHKGISTTNAEGLMTVRMTGDELKAKDALYGADQNSTVVYVTSVSATTTAKTSLVTIPGFYYYNNTLSKWVGLQMPKFFYMPSIFFDTTTLSTYTKDLYKIYSDQFSNPQVKSAGSFGKVPILGRSDLEYYITYMDTNVFTNVSIDVDGVMTYTIRNNASDISFINIVFVVK